ncbi:MAG: YheU family protein [Desulfuromonadales bacterium]
MNELLNDVNVPVIEVMDDNLEAAQEGEIEVPINRLNRETLLSVISEYVTREWEEMGLVSYTLEQKIEQVMVQLKADKAKLVFDPNSNSCNIIPNP